MFNLSAIGPQLLAALRPGAKLSDAVKAFGLQCHELDDSELKYSLERMQNEKGEAFLVFGAPEIFKGRKVAIIAVLGPLPEATEARGTPQLSGVAESS